MNTRSIFPNILQLQRGGKKNYFKIPILNLTASVGYLSLWQTLHHEAGPEDDVGKILTSTTCPNPKFPSSHFSVNIYSHRLRWKAKSSSGRGAGDRCNHTFNSKHSERTDRQTGAKEGSGDRAVWEWSHKLTGSPAEGHTHTYSHKHTSTLTMPSKASVLETCVIPTDDVTSSHTERNQAWLREKWSWCAARKCGFIAASTQLVRQTHWNRHAHKHWAQKQKVKQKSVRLYISLLSLLTGRTACHGPIPSLSSDPSLHYVCRCRGEGITSFEGGRAHPVFKIHGHYSIWD